MVGVDGGVGPAGLWEANLGDSFHYLGFDGAAGGVGGGGHGRGIVGGVVERLGRQLLWEAGRHVGSVIDAMCRRRRVAVV